MILCCGEALIDMLPGKTAEGARAYRPHTGGSVFNTAVALGRLGAPVQIFTGLSSDFFGDMLHADLRASGVDTSLAARSDRATTLAFVQLNDGHATYAFYDENTAGRMLSAADLPDVTADALFFGGVSLAVDPCGSAYETLMLREAGTRLTMIDPNIRPAFITDETRYRTRLMRMLHAADIIKTSDEDLGWIMGTPDAVKLLQETKASVVLLTKGGDGVTVITPDGHFDVPAAAAQVVDTVGAGDTFSAGFLARLQRDGHLTKTAIAAIAQHDLHAAVSFGAQVAAITVSRAGANPPWAAELCGP